MKIKLVKNRILRLLLLTLGFLCVILGVIGTVLPVLPTTPFLRLQSGRRCSQLLQSGLALCLFRSFSGFADHLGSFLLLPEG